MPAPKSSLGHRRLRLVRDNREREFSWQRVCIYRARSYRPGWRSLPQVPSESQVRAGDVADNGAPTANASAHAGYAVHYDEGPEVGYKWYEAQKKPLFPFGFGLSFTTYAYSGLSVDSAAKTARFTVKNTGKRTGTEIAQVYGRLPEGSDESFMRLVGWKRVTLAPGESQTVTVAIDDRVLKTFDEEKNAWNLSPGKYQVLAGSSSDNTPVTASLVVR
jgi:beta-glucosidase